MEELKERRQQEPSTRSPTLTRSDKLCLLSGETVVDSCSFRDEDDDCTFRYTVESLPSSKELLIQVLKDKGEPINGNIENPRLCLR